MIQQSAIRRHNDDQYGTTGYWYFHWPALKCIFRTDYEGMRFNPAEETEELTLEEFIALSIKYSIDRKTSTPTKPKERYYYANGLGQVWAQNEPHYYVQMGSGIELTPAEYITLSIMWNQNPDDTLL